MGMSTSFVKLYLRLENTDYLYCSPWVDKFLLLTIWCMELSEHVLLIDPLKGDLLMPPQHSLEICSAA